MFNKTFLLFFFGLAQNSALCAETVYDNMSNHLSNLQTEYQHYITQHPGQTFSSANRSLQVFNHQVMVDITARSETELVNIKSQLTQLGMTQISQYKKLLSGLMPINRLHELGNLGEISWASSSKAVRRVGPPGGAVFNAADPAMFTDVVRKKFNVDGSDITIGVLSDSYDCLGGAQDNVLSGDLPANIVILKEFPFCDAGGEDEGRAMMQLIHDIAPNANLMFHTATVSAVDFAQGIQLLADAGTDIIVDDVGYFDMPVFQEGPIAQSVNEAAAKGVSYFSAAGNNARLSYENSYTAGRQPFSNDRAHDFGIAAGLAADVYQKITIPKDTPVDITLHWDDPAEIAGEIGAQTDLDLFLLDQGKNVVITSSQDYNIGHNPVERISGLHTSDITDFYLYISHRAGPAPTRIKYIINGPVAPWPESSELIELDVNLNGPTPVIVFPDGNPISGGKAYIVYKNEFIFAHLLEIGTTDRPILIDSNGKPVVIIPFILFATSTSQIAEVGSGGLPIWFVSDGFIPLINAEGEIEIFRQDANQTPVSIDQYATNSGTIFGHPNASGAMAVGAIPYNETPWFGVPITQGRIENFSSAGGTPIIFSPNGSRLESPEFRFKPEIVAPDNTDTTFFGQDTDNNQFPNFSGTSAAAPHAAALAALLLDQFPNLSPKQVHKAMSKGSLDLLDPASVSTTAPQNTACHENTTFDWGTGCGLVQADLVFEAADQTNTGVHLTVKTSARHVSIGRNFQYTFTILNHSEQTLRNVRARALQLPQHVIYQQIDGCLMIDQQEASCLTPDLAPGQSHVINVIVKPTSIPSDLLTFEVDLLSDTEIDLSQVRIKEETPLLIIKADFNRDGCVDTSDWGILFSVFRSGTADSAIYDLTDDGQVSLDDLTELERLYSRPGGAGCF